MRVAAVGDSINWGQGLAGGSHWNELHREEKYIFKCVEWLQRSGIDATLDHEDFLPHSGAVIGTAAEVNAEPWLNSQDVNDRRMYDLYYGEVPSDVPTVLGQLKRLRSGSTVGLLFINGGPNDVGIRRSAGRGGDFDDAVRDVDDIARERLPNLLREARRVCPNALIVYTGYYPALSSTSRVPPGINVLSRIYPMAPAIVFLQVYWLLGEVVLRTQLPRLRRQGVAFHQRMLARFREQVASYNEEHGTELGNIFFSPSGFTNNNTMWSRNALVSAPGEDPNPDVTHVRERLCEIVDGKDIDGDVGKQRYCDIAYVGHPNPKGADRYFREIRKRLRAQMNFSLRQHLSDMDPDIRSLRHLKKRFPFAPVSNVRGLTNVRWLEVISIEWHMSGYVGPTRGSISVIYFDFGWGFQEVSYEYGRIGVVNLRANQRLDDIKHVHIRFPDYGASIQFNIRFDIKVNGCPISPIILSEGSFRKRGDYREWRMSSLQFEPEYA